ncbi:hypothetical protein GJ496_003308 [Pomphorhynchus laevis]|nr:hypothetical protein GJ496_003308 [Pomphorhynchus laevis]
MSRMTILGGSSHPSFVNAVCDYLYIKRGKLNSTYLYNGEISVELHESVRGSDVYVIQSGCDDINSNLMELLLIIDACKNASANQITAVIPCFPYAHQDINTKSRSPITAKLVANMLSSAGCNHIITMDLHASQIQGFFDIPVDNLYAEPLFGDWIRENIKEYESAVMVSPDAGGAKRVASIADKLGLEFALIHAGRRRRKELRSLFSEPLSIDDVDYGMILKAYGSDNSNEFCQLKQSEPYSEASSKDTKETAERLILVGNVKDRITIILDDLADSGITVLLAAQKLHQEGAREVYCLVTHGILSGSGIDNLNKAKLSKFVCTNTVPRNKKSEECPKFEIFDVTPMFGEAIRRTHNGESVSHLFRTSYK